MKTLRITLAALMILMTSVVASAQPMSVYAMRNNARFLTDRMAYTLGLPAAILDDLYYINYDYICGVNDYLDDVALGYRYDDYMEVLYARDYALRRLLTEAQWARLITYDYFYRPISFLNHRWSFGIYVHDHRMDHFYFGVPRLFNDYRGGRMFGGMPAGPRGPQGMVPGMQPERNVQIGRDGRIGVNRQGDIRNGAGNMQGEVTRQGGQAGQGGQGGQINLNGNVVRFGDGQGQRTQNGQMNQGGNNQRTQGGQMNQGGNRTENGNVSVQPVQGQTRTVTPTVQTRPNSSTRVNTQQNQQEQQRQQAQQRQQEQQRTAAQQAQQRQQAQQQQRTAAQQQQRTAAQQTQRQNVATPNRQGGNMGGGAARSGAGRR